jgi:hypothetical protein
VLVVSVLDDLASKECERTLRKLSAKDEKLLLTGMGDEMSELNGSFL